MESRVDPAEPVLLAPDQAVGRVSKAVVADRRKRPTMAVAAAAVLLVGGVAFGGNLFGQINARELTPASNSVSVTDGSGRAITPVDLANQTSPKSWAPRGSLATDTEFLAPMRADTEMNQIIYAGDVEGRRLVVLWDGKSTLMVIDGQVGATYEQMERKDIEWDGLRLITYATQAHYGGAVVGIAPPSWPPCRCPGAPSSPVATASCASGRELATLTVAAPEDSDPLMTQTAPNR